MLQSKSKNTLHIEQMLKDGHSAHSIAQEVGISHQRVYQIKKRLANQYVAGVQLAVQEGQTTCTPSNALLSDSFMKSLNIRVTTPVFDALTEACAIANRKEPDEAITVEEYVEECVTTRLVELGLLRKNKRK